MICGQSNCLTFRPGNLDEQDIVASLGGMKKRLQVFSSPDYNYVFNRETGHFARWGATYDDDPQTAPVPEIIDIEVTTICNNGCPFCYKGNTQNGRNMSQETFKSIIDRMPFLTQCAIGADAGGMSNPELFDMMRYARAKGIVPNITVADITDETADNLAELCGAVAVSRYANKNKCYDSVKRLTDRGMKQVNIHIMVSEETLGQVKETLGDYLTDPRLKKLNAIVLLSLKRKGRGVNHRTLSQEKFSGLVKFALDNQIPIGFDSCSAHKFAASVTGHEKELEFRTLTEPCESTLFSAYVDVDGKFWPCSFCEHDESFSEGIDVAGCADFKRDVWDHPRTIEWRKRLLDGGRKCPMYEV